MLSALGQLTVIECHLNQLKIYLKEFQADQPQKANQLNKELKKKMVNALLHACYSGQTEVLFMSPPYLSTSKSGTSVHTIMRMNQK